MWYPQYHNLLEHTGRVAKRTVMCLALTLDYTLCTVVLQRRMNKFVRSVRLLVRESPIVRRSQPTNWRRRYLRERWKWEGETLSDCQGKSRCRRSYRTNGSRFWTVSNECHKVDPHNEWHHSSASVRPCKTGCQPETRRPSHYAAVSLAKIATLADVSSRSRHILRWSELLRLNREFEERISAKILAHSSATISGRRKYVCVHQ